MAGAKPCSVGDLMQLATLTAKRSNTLVPCSEGAVALNSGVSGEGALSNGKNRVNRPMGTRLSAGSNQPQADSLGCCFG